MGIIDLGDGALIIPGGMQTAGDRGHLLIGQVWILDAGEASRVAVSEHVAEFAAQPNPLT